MERMPPTEVPPVVAPAPLSSSSPSPPSRLLDTLLLAAVGGMVLTALVRLGSIEQRLQDMETKLGEGGGREGGVSDVVFRPVAKRTRPRVPLRPPRAVSEEDSDDEEPNATVVLQGNDDDTRETKKEEEDEEEEESPP